MFKRLGLSVALTLVMALISVSVVAAQATPRTYIVIAQSETYLPTGFDHAIRNAGGTVVARMPGAGLVVATSANPRFASSVQGARAVVPSIRRDFHPGQLPVESVVVQAGAPPFSDDDDTRFNLQWGINAVNAQAAWARGYRGQGVIIAVLDEGFGLTHPDLAPNFLQGASMVPGEPVLFNSAALRAPFSHGSHVAGIIMAPDNAFGTIGVAPQSKVVPVKVLSEILGYGEDAWVLAGMYYAADYGVNLINMSLGGTLDRRGACVNPADPATCYTARDVRDIELAYLRATNYAERRGVTVFSSAGNAATEVGPANPFLVKLPAQTPNIVSITSTAPIGWAVDPTTSLDNFASYSNWGLRLADFAAPGGDFVYPGNENCTVAGLTRPCWVFDMVFSPTTEVGPGLFSFSWSAGTSMASPHAAGVAALLISEHGPIRRGQLTAMMARYAEDLGTPGYDKYFGRGRVEYGFR